MELFTPEVGLIFWMLIPFLIVLFILGKYAWPMIIDGVDKRARFIDDSVRSAQEANERLTSIKEEGEAILAEARKEQMRILNETNQMRSDLIEEAKKQAQLEADNILSSAQITIQKEKEDILRQVRSEIASISIEIAEKVIRENLNTTAEQENMIDRLLQEINSTGKN
ncbi:MAG: F0F1 ATP synthase subunit B [Candidatus Azobacteroides sp.]|nr:F0F1 ATP synthase subunit B [Candidatus Azobacteroides sp.]